MRRNTLHRMGLAGMATAAAAFALSLLGGAPAFGGAAPGTGIVGSKHDMLLYTAANGGVVDPHGRVCAYCHTPHHAVDDPNADYMPLWSRQVTQEPVFIEYSSPTLDAVITDPVAGPSRLCMSCHDGAVAIDAYYGSNGTATLTEGDAFGEIGIGLNGDLSNDHPIGFDYPSVALADPEIKDASSVFIENAVGTTIADVLWDDGSGNQLMTCATCHDVHNGPSTATSGTDPGGWFLYAPQNNAKICLSCHDK
ncbi:cytochrome C [Dissulfurirhabdus thermomarina]|uniref:Cytochrome C n=1 Tax=Dissulfurirhabdus thermomarina TaxID=1765737 RepID=A0A6N9TLV3_DISTH|nr:cytochrome c3 family protein [Dissulfurirhabdus thermomarina]NDY41410.1 cytochrome C [Dissulfurirhabdus thermomarina]NMX24398.1 cytochrome C [Dissulfurirhabdus thermomarina]